jgi:hypothetical protein
MVKVESSDLTSRYFGDALSDCIVDHSSRIESHPILFRLLNWYRSH